ncbi:response regulator transcription factor [Cellulomonas sp.]|uniref:response regulator transcription factor n=1 Tax=Cellulomonas sp. TaxID=40001 RepID=UPI002D3E8441|nr:response regulator transcription factor [Cellulomonas sp.]HYQ73855.1 response regulator transcription factor [Cellulomonas sp.]
MIDVVLADDHPVVRAGLRSVLDGEPDLRVVAETGTAEELVAWTAAHRADVVLLDLRFGPGRMSGAEATAVLTRRGGPAVLVVTTYGSDADILAAVEAGATGYLLKDAPTDDLVRAVRAAAAGRVTLGPAVQERLLGRVRSPQLALTSRELDVLRLVAAGRSNDEIARELYVSRATVKTHLAHLYDKLGVTSRTRAVAVARERGVLAV